MGPSLGVRYNRGLMYTLAVTIDKNSQSSGSGSLGINRFTVWVHCSAHDCSGTVLPIGENVIKHVHSKWGGRAALVPSSVTAVWVNTMLLRVCLNEWVLLQYAEETTPSSAG